MALYEVVLKGTFAGQAVNNVLWYRDIIPAIELGEFMDLLSAIGSTVKDQVWHSQAPLHVRGMGLQEVLPDTYTLNAIDVKAYNADFTLVSDTPVTIAVNETGSEAGPTQGVDRCAILKANLEPSFGPGIGLPKRGYLAIGPILEAYVTDDGHLTDAARAAMDSLGNNLATNIETTLPPTVLFPIRTRVTRVLHVVTNISWKDVNDFVPRRLTSTRKSRRPEA